jgi:serine/threonine protein kinase
LLGTPFAIAGAMAHAITEALRVHAGATLMSIDQQTPGSGTWPRLCEPDDTLRDADPIVDRCAHFEIERPIGKGGMGLVYRAWDRVLHRHVALKIMPDSSEGPCRSRPHSDEARAQARLSSPHVVHVYYVGRAPHPENQSVESSFFAMELCEGGTLNDVIERGECLEPVRARAYLMAVARGLLDALAAGIVHRDIKPRNLLLDEHGRVRIADFGLARRLDQNGKLIVTRTGGVVGTPLYMAPEQARGEYRSPCGSLSPVVRSITCCAGGLHLRDRTRCASFSPTSRTCRHPSPKSRRGPRARTSHRSHAREESGSPLPELRRAALRARRGGKTARPAARRARRRGRRPTW